MKYQWAESQKEDSYPYIQAYYASRHKDFVRALRRSVSTTDATLHKAISYFFSKDGKHIRPLLTLLACEITGGQYEEAINMACAVELVHSSALIVDDLPCMDDASVRRGQECLHKRFGDAIAILTAFYFLAKAFQLVGESQRNAEEAAIALANAITDEGMVCGQIWDIAGGSDLDIVRDSKTTPLFVAAMRLGAFASGANEVETRALIRFGEGWHCRFSCVMMCWTGIQIFLRRLERKRSRQKRIATSWRYLVSLKRR